MEDLLSILMPQDYKENLQLPDPALLQFYTDLDNRTYWVEGEVTDALLDLVSKIVDWNRQDKGKPVEERTPIKIYIYSPGGGLDMAKALIEMIKISKTPVYTYALGMCASAASMIFLSGHKRFATKNAYWLFHQGSCQNIGGSYQEVQSFMEDYKKQVAELETFYKENTTYDPEYIEEKLKGDWYIYKDEAVEHGIVNELVEDIDMLF